MATFENVISNLEWSRADCEKQLDEARKEVQAASDRLAGMHDNLNRHYERILELDGALAVLKANGGGQDVVVR